MVIEIKGREVRAPKYLVKREDRLYSFPRRIDEFRPKAEIELEGYVLTPKGDFPRYILNTAITMRQSLDGLKHVNAHRKAHNIGLRVPTVKDFLPYYMHVNEALKGENVLYDASGNVIEEERLKGYANTINYNCWVWLNARFPKGNGFLGLDLVVITSFDSKGNPLFLREPLEDCLEETCWAELESANSQGIPTKRSKIERYIPGKVIRFNSPAEGGTARFCAISDWARLDCDKDLRASVPSLGAFLCADGAYE